VTTQGNHGPAAIRRVRPVVPRASWVLLTAVTIVGMLNGLYVLLVPVGGQTELAGRMWEQFAAQDQEVASIYAMDLALLGIIWTAFSLLAAINLRRPLSSGREVGLVCPVAGFDHLRWRRHPHAD